MVRVGIIGTGNIGKQHIELLESGAVTDAELTATTSRSSTSQPGKPRHFTDYITMLESGMVDAVIIATPTMNHAECAREAFARGIHVLVEKPVAMSMAEANSLLDEVPSTIKFAVMLNQRFHPAYREIKAMMDQSVIGDLHRFSWTMTAWYRPDIYYRVSNWRGTWRGEGGGLLINQCIHNLDILQWLFGLPSALTAKANFGRYHAIDVEDEVTSMMSFAGGTTGILIASSGEAPGLNRLEIIGDKGMISFDDQVITLHQADQRVSTHCATTTEMFGMPTFEERKIDAGEPVNQHAAVIQNFIDAIAADRPLLTPATEGLGSLQLANAMLLSAWQGSPVDLPIDAQAHQDMLDARIAASQLRRAESLDVTIDMEKSYR